MVKTLQSVKIYQRYFRADIISAFDMPIGLLRLEMELSINKSPKRASQFSFTFCTSNCMGALFLDDSFISEEGAYIILTFSHY